MKWIIIKFLKSMGLYSLARLIWRIYDRYHFLRRWREKKFFSHFIQQGNLVYDVGACFGEKTSIFLRLGAKVIAVEPAQSSLSVLRQAFARNPRVILVPYGLAAKKGNGTLSICTDEPAIATMNPTWKRRGRFAKDFQWKQSEKIPLTTLDALIRHFGKPVFCKIDVEGSELSVIHGLSQAITFLSFEFHKEFLKDTLKCLNHLTTLGPVVFNFTAYDQMKLHLPFWVSKKQLYSALISRTDPYLWGDIYAHFKGKDI